jgi:hypothetical protein
MCITAFLGSFLKTKSVDTEETRSKLKPSLFIDDPDTFF